MAPSYLLQHVGERSPGSANFSMEGSEATEVYVIRPMAYEEDPDRTPIDMTEVIEEFVLDTLGSCEPSGNGGLSRGLPKAHPQFPRLFAQSIGDFRGAGHKDAQTARIGQLTAAEPALEAPPITDYYWQYPVYFCTIRFTSRLHPILSDDQIAIETISWYDVDDESRQSVQASEWERFTEVEYEPAPEWAHAQQGNYVFRRGDGTAVGSPPPHLYSAGGFPKLMMPKAIVKIRWYAVPQEWLLSRNSPLVARVGFVNQMEWWGWEPAELLYVGCRVIRTYAPPMSEREVTENGSVTFTIKRLVDLELTFEETTRTTPSAPTPGKNNWIVAHHNLAFWLKDRKAYYLTAPDASPSRQTPMYPSFPIGLLFSDPDVEA